MTERHEPKVDPLAHAAPKGMGFPWGLLVMLGLYGLAVLGYVWHTYWNAADYQAAQHYQAAWDILGRDEGRKSSPAQLEQAYHHLLEAARLKPDVKTFHDDLESLNWRFDERNLTLPPGLKNSAEAVAMLWTRIQQERKPILVVGLRDKGWGPEQVMEGPKKVAQWSPIGVVFIFAFWAFGRFNEKKIRERELEEDLVRMQAEVDELGKFREGLGEAPRKRRPKKRA